MSKRFKKGDGIKVMALKRFKKGDGIGQLVAHCLKRFNKEGDGIEVMASKRR